MKLYARQGDVVIQQEPTTVTDLIATTNLVIAGARSHPHAIVGPCLYRRDGNATLVRVEAATTMRHSGLHPTVALEPGDYVIRSLRERGDKDDRQVED